MIIKEIEKNIIYNLKIEENNIIHHYRRIDKNLWEENIINTIEPVTYREDLEKLFNDYMNQLQFQEDNINHDSNSIKYNNSEIIKSHEEFFCFICDRLTKWIDINFETYVCSPKCSDILWENYKRDSGRC